MDVMNGRDFGGTVTLRRYDRSPDAHLRMYRPKTFLQSNTRNAVEPTTTTFTSFVHEKAMPPSQIYTTANSSAVTASAAESSSYRNERIRSARSETNLRSSIGRSQSAMLSDEELFQIQLMYSSRATELVVCTCLANLYMANARVRSNGKTKAPSRANEWNLTTTGVPLLLLDCGSTQTRSIRRLRLIIAEKGTGFILWKDTIDSLTQYTELGGSFHTLLLSTNHQRMAGLSFDSAFSAIQFYRQVDEMTSNPQNVQLSTTPDHNPSSRRRHSFNGGVKKNLVKKAEISYPCCFNHVTSLKSHQILETSTPKRAQSCIQIDQEKSQKLPSPTRSF